MHPHMLKMIKFQLHLYLLVLQLLLLYMDNGINHPPPAPFADSQQESLRQQRNLDYLINLWYLSGEC